ncbi:MAG TPA: radical SAM protein [Blastocatellia bacterium]|nr:radical SAM protein [Blastocatellia bacterium]
MYVPQRFVTVHLTRRCNSRSRFCTTDPMGRDPDTLSLDEVDRFLGENAGKGFEAVSVIGGEPTVLQSLPEVLKLAKKYQYPVTQMFTNARRLARREYAEKIVGLGVSLFIVSLHGHTSEVHDWITEAPGSFEQALAGIANIKSLGQKVQTLSVVTRQNYRYLKELVQVLIEADVDLIDLSGLCPGGLAILNWRDLVVSYREIYPFLGEAIETAKSAHKEVILEGFPFCAVRPYEGLCVEHADTRKERMLFHGYTIEDYDTCLNTVHKLRVKQCDGCSVSHLCGGVYKQYFESYGDEEFTAIGTGSREPSRPRQLVALTFSSTEH